MRSRSFWANGILGYIIIHRWAWWGRNVAKSWLVEEEEELKIEVWEKSERLGLRRTNHSTAILGNSRGRCGVLSSISTWLCQCNVYDDHDDKLPSSLHRCYYLENLCEDAPKCMPKNYNDTVTRPSHAMFYLLRYFNKYRLECSSAITYNGTRRAAQVITRSIAYLIHEWVSQSCVEILKTMNTFPTSCRLRREEVEAMHFILIYSFSSKVHYLCGTQAYKEWTSWMNPVFSGEYGANEFQ